MFLSVSVTAAETGTAGPSTRARQRRGTRATPGPGALHVVLRIVTDHAGVPLRLLRMSILSLHLGDERRRVFEGRAVS